LWIQPAAGDAGGALGAALFVWHQLLDKPRAPRGDSQKGSLLGPSFQDDEISRFLSETEATSTHFADDQELCDHVAALLAEGKIVGWFQGRMEFGPRALGGRSILADPRSEQMQSKLNLKIKFRESFRPFAPIVLHEHAHEWFDLRKDQESPYMLLVAPVREEHRVAIDDTSLYTMRHDPDLRKRVNIPRSTIPAVTHVDYSARVQTVDNERNPRLHRLLESFMNLTDCPVLVNTSFNVRGEPIVCTPQDAYRCFEATDMDVLVLENHVVVKNSSMTEASLQRREAHLARYDLD
jgi:carbamoyltransferase